MMCKTLKVYILWLFVSNPVFSQSIVPIDKDTYEIVENVNYLLYKDKKVVYKGITLADRITSVRNDIVFDSISFSRADYEDLGLLKADIDSLILLSKKTIYLDEVVINSGDRKEILLGETNRFVKRRSAILSKDLVNGLVFSNGSSQNLKLTKLMFYVEKVKVKTAYRINFSEVSETTLHEGFQIAEPGGLIYATDTLYLNLKDKNKIEVPLPEDFNLPADKKIFVWIQLLGYYDENGSPVDPEKDKLTRLKFQMSDKTNYYSRMYDGGAMKDTEFIINLNLFYNYEFARQFFTRPHKSVLVAPAIVLYAQNAG